MRTVANYQGSYINFVDFTMTLPYVNFSSRIYEDRYIARYNKILCNKLLFMKYKTRKSYFLHAV